MHDIIDVLLLQKEIVMSGQTIWTMHGPTLLTAGLLQRQMPSSSHGRSAVSTPQAQCWHYILADVVTLLICSALKLAALHLSCQHLCCNVHVLDA